MNRILCLAVSLVTIMAAADAAPNDAFVGVRVLKQQGVGDIDWSVQLPKDCSGCRLEINEFTSHENPKEFYFHVSAPKSLGKVAGVRVKVDPARVRGVLAGRAHLLFSKTKDGITFDIPLDEPPASARLPTHSTQYERTGVTQLYTYIDTPGVQTRVEHADEQRRYGKYATGSWPALERQAALNLQFAAREAVTALGLDVTMEEKGLGTILLMGFDTNYPTMGVQAAHPDYPPHWHMHVYWTREPKIRVVGHPYIDPNGLLTYNSVGGSAERGQKIGRFERGQTHETLTPDGEVLFTHTITPEGHFILGAALGTCRFTPLAGGFHTGVDLACDNGAPARSVRAEDDFANGRLRIFLNGRLVEEHFYDADNGVLERSEIDYEASDVRTSKDGELGPPRVEKDGTIHVPAFDLPESAFLRDETRAALQRARDVVNKEVVAAFKTCPPIEKADRATAPAIRKCEADAFYQTSLYRRMRERYAVAMTPQDIGGVYTEVFAPTQGVTRRNEKRVLINVHGGGFQGGSRTLSHLESIPIAFVGKIKVISVDYRLAPEYTFPAASEDVAAVYRELLKTYEPENIGIYGCSAGGALTAQSIVWFEREKLPLPRAIGMFCSGGESIDHDGLGKWVRSDAARINAALTGQDFAKSRSYYRGADLKSPLLSPGDDDEVMAKFPPSLLISGTRDFALSSVLVTHAQLVRLDVEADLHVWEGMGHAFHFDPDLPESREAYDVIIKFFDSHLGR